MAASECLTPCAFKEFGKSVFALDPDQQVDDTMPEVEIGCIIIKDAVKEKFGVNICGMAAAGILQAMEAEPQTPNLTHFNEGIEAQLVSAGKETQDA